MKPTTLQMVKLAMEADDTLSPTDRQTILAVCRDPMLVATGAKQTDAPTYRWLTPKQAAAALSVSLRTVQRLVISGALPSRKVMGCRRIPSSALAGQAAPLTAMPNSVARAGFTHWHSLKTTAGSDCAPMDKTPKAG